jgi:hypothetical protein
MRKIIALPLILYALHCSAKPAGDYYSCTGSSGIASNQAQIPFVKRTITASKNAVTVSFYIGSKEVVVDGVPLMAGDYKICQSSDQALWFSPSDTSYFCGNSDVLDNLGVFNRATGELRYHDGDALFIVTCKKRGKTGPSA